MTQEELLRMVEPMWQRDFESFVDSGEASEAFLRYMNQDASCQRAVDAVFRQQAAALEELSRDLRAERRLPWTPRKESPGTAYHPRER